MTAAAAVSYSGWSAPSYDPYAFAGQRRRAVSAETGISFGDFLFMHQDRRSVKQVRRLPDPDFATDLSKLKPLVVAICETQLYIAHRNRPFDETKSLTERLEEIARCATARLPDQRKVLDALLARHYEGQRSGMSREELRSIEIQIQNVDTRILILPRLAAVITSILYRFYFLGYSSVEVCRDLPGVRPQMVRQLCRRARNVWDKLNGGCLYALPNGEFVRMPPPGLSRRKALGIVSHTYHSSWTAERIETLVRMFKDGQTQQRIADELGISGTTVSLMVRRKELTRKPLDRWRFRRNTLQAH
jgi:hypothetical protein